MRPLERLETRAETLLGRGAAVSLDVNRIHVTVRVWEPKGHLFIARTAATKTEAIAWLLRVPDEDFRATSSIAPNQSDCAGIFVSEKGGTFICDCCIPLVPGLQERLGDVDVEVWEEGSGGWVARDGIVCRLCSRVIDVVLLSEEDSDGDE